MPSNKVGCYLRDANVLYRDGSYASAMVLGLFAQEELGRWSMLRDLRKKVLDGKHLTVKEIQDHCGESREQTKSWHDEHHYEGRPV